MIDISHSLKRFVFSEAIRRGPNWLSQGVLTKLRTNLFKPVGWTVKKQSCTKLFIAIAVAMTQKRFYTTLPFYCLLWGMSIIIDSLEQLLK